MSRHDLFKLVRLNHQTPTLRQYDACLEKFLEWVPDDRRTIRDYAEIDEILTEFVIHVYETCSGANRHLVTNTKNVLMLYLNLPSELFRLTHLSLKGWEKEIPVEPKQVCPRIVAYGLAWKLIREGYFDMGVAVLLAYDCYLRAQDIRNLTVAKLLLETSGPFAGGVVVLGDARGRTKGGLHESLTIRLPFLIILLARLKNKRLRECPNDPSSRVFPFASQTRRKKIHEMAAAMSIGHLGITRHNLRHWGASQDYFDHALTTQDIMIRGRWKTKKSLQSYLRPGCILS